MTDGPTSLLMMSLARRLRRFDGRIRAAGLSTILGAFLLAAGHFLPSAGAPASWVSLTNAGAVLLAIGWILLLASVRTREAVGRTGSRELDMLLSAVDTASASVAIFAPDDTLIACNSTFRGRFAAALSRLEPPVRYADLLRADLARFLAPEQVEAAFEPRLEEYRKASGQFRDVRDPDGSWWRVVKHRLPGGGTATFATDVTEMKRRDEQLRRLQEAVAATPIQVAVFDPDGRLGFANPSLAALLEAGGVAVADRPVYADCARALLPQGVAGEAAETELAARLAAHQAVAGTADEFLYPDGRWRSVTKVRLSDGSIAGFSVDIQARKQREQELEMLRESIANMPFPFAIYAPDQVLIAWNRGFEEIYRDKLASLPQPVTYQALVRASLSQRLDPAQLEDEIAERVAVHRVADGHGVDRMNADGRWRRVTKVKLSSGAIATFTFDIDELKQRTAELERSEAMFRTLSETVPVAIWSLDRNGDTAFVNPTLRSLLGQQAQATPTRRFSDVVVDAPPMAQLPGRRFESDLVVEGEPRRRVLVVTSPWQADRSGVATCLAALIDITELNEAQRTIELFALHDPLTGLKNRTGFGRLLESRVPVASEVAPVCLLAVDLDLFKDVNDRFGHAAGDRVLREVADRMREVLGPEAGLCRLGGDEFAILLQAAPAEARDVAARLLARIGETIDVGAGLGEVGASIGIAAAPIDTTEIETLLRYADLAMYRAKALGRNRAVAFDASLDEEVRNRRRIEAELVQALELGELRLVFQPQFQAESGALSGLEALLRWHNPRIGRDVSPGIFIPVAEQTGLIARIDSCVLDHALAQLVEWREQGFDPPGISVNVSPATLREPGYAERVIQAIERAGLPPHLLEIEVTEGVALTDRAQAGEVLHRLRGYGVGVALDDFGAGFASLGQIKALPLTRLKIDRSLVERVAASENDGAIIRAIAALGAALGMPTLAEGVETEEQLEAIRRLGCTEVQGFLWGVPLEADRFAATWLDDRASAAIGVGPARGPSMRPRRLRLGGA